MDHYAANLFPASLRTNKQERWGSLGNAMVVGSTRYKRVEPASVTCTSLFKDLGAILCGQKTAAQEEQEQFERDVNEIERMMAVKKQEEARKKVMEDQSNAMWNAFEGVQLLAAAAALSALKPKTAPTSTTPAPAPAMTTTPAPAPAMTTTPAPAPAMTTTPEPTTVPTEVDKEETTDTENADVFVN